MLTSVSSTVATSFEENESGNTPEGIWSDDYANHVHPWGGDDRAQFKQYHDYDSMRQRMLQLAEQSYSYQGQDVDIMSFHEGLNGGTCLLYTSQSPRDFLLWRLASSA